MTAPVRLVTKTQQLPPVHEDKELLLFSYLGNLSYHNGSSSKYKGEEGAHVPLSMLSVLPEFSQNELVRLRGQRPAECHLPLGQETCGKLPPR
jgi:hypothetical protein